MQQLSDHSMYGYLSRMSTACLESVLIGRDVYPPREQATPEVYDMIEEILRTRPDADTLKERPHMLSYLRGKHDDNR